MNQASTIRRAMEGPQGFHLYFIGPATAFHLAQHKAIRAHSNNFPLSVGAMLAVALLAAAIPARRAGHVEPMTALRYE